LASDKPGALLGWLKKILAGLKNPVGNNYRVNRLRPPAAVDEPDFMALCIRCNRCLEVCPYSSIERDGPGPTIGTPYVLPKKEACYLCMACCALCPTGALNPGLTNPEKVRMGKARIDPDLCYSHIFLSHDKLPDSSMDKIAALCNTCYNVCPFPDKAIGLKDNLFPVVLDGCVGCGICVLKCPTGTVRAINVIPRGMERKDEAGFHFRKARQRYEKRAKDSEARSKDSPMTGEALIEKKMEIEGQTDGPDFDFPYEPVKTIEEWE
jgi:ferredoxin-type protein NapG